MLPNNVNHVAGYNPACINFYYPSSSLRSLITLPTTTGSISSR